MTVLGLSSPLVFRSFSSSCLREATITRKRCKRTPVSPASTTIDYRNPLVSTLIWSSYTIQSRECWAQHSAVLEPATPNDGHLLQPSVLHCFVLLVWTVLHCFLLLVWNILFFACGAQYSSTMVPATPNDGILPRPLIPQFQLQMLTTASVQCCEQYTTVFETSTRRNDDISTQPSILYFFMLEKLHVPVLGVLSGVFSCCLPHRVICREF